MSKLVTAFLGVAHIHTPGFIQTLNGRAEEITVKAAYDHDSARGEKRAAALPGCAFVSDPQAIYDDPEITSVVICSETLYHRELAIKAAQAGKHLFIEKPLGLGADDSRAIAEAIAAAGVIFQTGFFMRSSPTHQWIKREVTAGNLGNLTRIRYTNCHNAALGRWFIPDWGWLYDPKLAGGGAFLDLGAHVLDLIVDTYIPVLGEVPKVAASLGNQFGAYGPEIDEYGTGLLTFASGASAVLEASWVDAKFHSPIEVFGTAGQIQVVDGKVHYYSEKVDGADGKVVTDLPPGGPHAFDLFWDKLLGKEVTVPLVGVDQAALASALMERMYQAAGRSTTSGIAG